METGAKNQKSPSIKIFDMTSDLCVWSKAGVRSEMMCVNAFDCLNCPVDRKMKADVRSGKLVDGRALAGKPETGRASGMRRDDRPCRHMLSGRVPVKYCVNEYDCDGCDFHQTIMDEGHHGSFKKAEREYVGGFAVADNYYYHIGHTWVRVEYGGLVRVGLDDFAWRLFGPFDRIELPRIGGVVEQGSSGIRIDRDNLTAVFLSPLSGIVLSVNPKIAGKNGLEADEPYDGDWLFVLEPQKLKAGLRNLLFGEESVAWQEKEAERLAAMVSDDTEYELAASGGRAVADIYGQTPGLEWELLKKEFLHTGK